MDNTKLLERIQKLFTLAEKNENDHEAQSALLTAQKLMVENGIMRSEVERLSETPSKEVVHGEVASGERLLWWKKQLVRIIALNFRCKPYSTRSVGIVFLGLKDDVELAKTIYEFAKESLKCGADRYMVTYKKRYPRQNLYHSQVKNDYMVGWLRGLEDQYQEQVDRHNWGLVLVVDGLVLKAHQDMNLNKTVRSRVDCAGSDHAGQAGYQDGKSFNGTSKRLTEAT